MGTTYSKAPQKGKTVIVTGANSGIGYYTALELGKLGANVILVARDKRRGQEALSSMHAAHPDGNYELEICDVSDLEDVEKFATRFLKRNVPLDTLVNNAGIMMLPSRELSPQGFELQTATNHLGHFALTGLLLPALLKSSTPRVVNISSITAWIANVKPSRHNIDFIYESNYNPTTAYSNTKLCNLVFTSEMSKRYPQILTVAAHPGGALTNLLQHGFKWMSPIFQTADQGALPSIRAATDENVVNGSYFAPLLCVRGSASWAWWPIGARGEALGNEVWSRSVEATKVKF